MSVAIVGDFLTTAEAAKIIGVSTARVRQFHLNGRLKAERVGTMLVFDRKKIEKFARQTRPTGRPPAAS